MRCSGRLTSLGGSLPLASNTGLLVVLMTTYLGQNPVLLHPLVESLEQAIKTLIITDDYIGQTASASFLATEYIVVLIIMGRGEFASSRSLRSFLKKSFNVSLIGFPILMVLG